MLHIFNRKPIHSILIIFHSIITREKISSSRKINTIHNFLLIKFNIKCKLIAKFIFTIFYITRLRLILISKIRDRTQPIQFAKTNRSLPPLIAQLLLNPFRFLFLDRSITEGKSWLTRYPAKTRSETRREFKGRTRLKTGANGLYMYIHGQPVPTWSEHSLAFTYRVDQPLRHRMQANWVCCNKVRYLISPDPLRSL